MFVIVVGGYSMQSLGSIGACVYFFLSEYEAVMVFGSFGSSWL